METDLTNPAVLRAIIQHLWDRPACAPACEVCAAAKAVSSGKVTIDPKNAAPEPPPNARSQRKEG